MLARLFVLAFFASNLALAAPGDAVVGWWTGLDSQSGDKLSLEIEKTGPVGDVDAILHIDLAGIYSTPEHFRVERNSKTGKWTSTWGGPYPRYDVTVTETGIHFVEKFHFDPASHFERETMGLELDKNDKAKAYFYLTDNLGTSFQKAHISTMQLNR